MGHGHRRARREPMSMASSGGTGAVGVRVQLTAEKKRDAPPPRRCGFDALGAASTGSLCWGIQGAGGYKRRRTGCLTKGSRACKRNRVPGRRGWGRSKRAGRARGRWRTVGRAEGEAARRRGTKRAAATLAAAGSARWVCRREQEQRGEAATGMNRGSRRSQTPSDRAAPVPTFQLRASWQCGRVRVRRKWSLAAPFAMSVFSDMHSVYGVQCDAGVHAWGIK